MFILTELADTVAITSNALRIEAHLAIKDALNKKYSNKLIPSVGLALGMYDILTCGEGKVRWGDGLLYYRVTFRMVVFQPFEGETLMGQVHSSTEDHVRVTIGFFTDIYIPKRNMPRPSTYDPSDKAWFWVWTDGNPDMYGDKDLLEEIPTESRMYLDRKQTIRFKVESLEWQEVEPLPPSVRDKPTQIDPNTGFPVALTEEELELRERGKERDAGLKVIAHIRELGLGVLEWWGNPEDVELPGGVAPQEMQPADEEVDELMEE